MKYIRTGNNIYKISKILKNGNILIKGKFHIDKNLANYFKLADTIEELCDEFCYIKDGVVSQYLTIDFKYKREDEYCSLRNKLTANGIAEITKGISKYELENGKLKLAIWTDKGLIYVAKMNKKGELELI